MHVAHMDVSYVRFGREPQLSLEIFNMAYSCKEATRISDFIFCCNIMLQWQLFTFLQLDRLLVCVYLHKGGF